jgi:hypothetical protein
VTFRPKLNAERNRNLLRWRYADRSDKTYHVQSIKAILQSGTTYSTGSVIGVDAGTDGAGVFSGNSSNTSQTALAARFSQPRKPKKLEMIGGTVMALATSSWLFSKGPLVFLQLGNSRLAGMGDSHLHEKEQAISGRPSEVEGSA